MVDNDAITPLKITLEDLHILSISKRIGDIGLSFSMDVKFDDCTETDHIMLCGGIPLFVTKDEDDIQRLILMEISEVTEYFIIKRCSHNCSLIIDGEEGVFSKYRLLQWMKRDNDNNPFIDEIKQLICRL